MAPPPTADDGCGGGGGSMTFTCLRVNKPLRQVLIEKTLTNDSTREGGRPPLGVLQSPVGCGGVSGLERGVRDDSHMRGVSDVEYECVIEDEYMRLLEPCGSWQVFKKRKTDGIKRYDNAVSQVIRQDRLPAPPPFFSRQEGKEQSMRLLKWLEEWCADMLKSEHGTNISDYPHTVPELMGRVLDEVASSQDDAAGLQSNLLDLVGPSCVEYLSLLLQRRSELLCAYERARDEALTKELLGSAVVRPQPTFIPNLNVVSERDRQLDKQLRKREKKARNKGLVQATDEDCMSTSRVLAMLGFGDSTVKQPGVSASSSTTSSSSISSLSCMSRFRGPTESTSSLFAAGTRCSKPEGAVVTRADPKHQNYDQVYIPPPKALQVDESSLLPLSCLPSWAQVAFSGLTKFNHIQTSVIKSAILKFAGPGEVGDNERHLAEFLRPESMLVSAPTGAGKTNIALLCIIQQLNEARQSNIQQTPSALDFKVVYIAPMKSLVAEIVDKFAPKLLPLGLKVSELTGDMQLTKKELEEVHVIVTVPEKWDILTRNAGSAGAVSDNDTSLIKAVKCLIIDEIHLLNDSRGPVIEAIVARYLRFIDQSQTHEARRIVGISATLPNGLDIAAFLHVSDDNIFYFGPECRPIPLEQSFVGINEKDVTKRKVRMTEVCYEKVTKSLQEGNQCMVFVHTRAETAHTAEALLQIAQNKGQAHLFDPTVLFCLLD
eukprot:GHVQ01014158.1.p1 GENE.GHVQ01014158.1~~GHVQ01014158.1.p1  ORF type:complete len:716 (+),score=142.63 GHVQ01014158.1:307-2454(+)